MNQKVMHKIFGKQLPTPRLLSPSDPLFQTSQMKRGVQQRKADEKKLEAIQTNIIACVQSNDRKCIENNMQRVNEVLYGKGVNMQAREEFLVKYGCTPYDGHILDRILSFDRPIMDIGAGNGQWSRALSDRIKEMAPKGKGKKIITSDYVVAYDDGSAIPLNSEIYHKLTKPARDYFYNVQKMDGISAVKQLKNRGKLLLLVYPPPGEMAIDLVKSYSEFPENDLIVFVGEGVGGANGSISLFEYLKNVDKDGNAWVLLESMEVPAVQGGGKGFEKVFIFRKVQMKSK
eukprot:scaffold583_cov279-Chaetoceros_neogracile.AAC.26